MQPAGQMKNVADALQKALNSQNKEATALKPYYHRLELINQELQRTHATIQVCITNRENSFTHDEFLKELRKGFLLSLDDLAAAVESIRTKEAPHVHPSNPVQLHAEPRPEGIDPDSPF